MSEKLNEILGASAGIGMAALGYLLLGVAIFLIIGIITVIISGRKNLFKRNNKVYNVLTKIYYPYIPIILAIFGGIFGAIYGLNQSINKNIEAQSKLLMESIIPQLPDLQSFIDENLDSMEIAGLSTGDFVEKYLNKDSTKVERGFFAGITNKAGKWVLEGVIDGVISYSAGELGIESGTTRNTLSTLRSIDFNHLDESASKMASGSIKKQVNAFFGGLYISQLINLLLFLIVPIVEILIYFLLIRKKISSAPEAE